MRPRFSTVVVAVVTLVLGYSLVNDLPTGSPDRLLGSLPVLNGGRVKPMDTLARSSLLVLSGRQAVSINGRAVSAVEWMSDMLFRPRVADEYKVFEIDDPDVLGVLDITGGARRYSFSDLQTHLGDLEVQAGKAEQRRPEQRSRFQGAVLALWNKVILYWRLQNSLQWADPDGVLPGVDGQVQEFEAFEAAMEGSGEAVNAKVREAFEERYHTLAERAEFRPLPPWTGEAKEWLSLGQSLANRAHGQDLHPGVLPFARMGDAKRKDDGETYLSSLMEFTRWLSVNAPASLAHARRERLLNRFDPFYKSLVLYVGVCALVFVSLLKWPGECRRAAFGLLVVAFVLHSGGILARMIVQGRPPVTNLYSSAVFVGWGAVLLGVVLERVFRNGLAALGAASIGFLTQIVALHLAVQGDTMEMMRAVLDSNFWLATHVVTVTAGYSSTFLSGVLAIVYVTRRTFGRNFSDATAHSLTRMVYGVVCFSMFFSFLGTVLGGIWADQSWGRFWGWDPKENGALMIVLWNALILHVWWGKKTGPMGLMQMAVFGNVITAVSWFGVNMLGIGLHSYGFMDKAFFWLMAFIAAHLAIMGVCALPFQKRDNGADAP